MRVLVTGGAGFIGSHVVDALLADGHEVAVMDNLCTGHRENVNPNCRFYEVDIRDSNRVCQAVREFQPDVINHHAAQAEVPKSIADPSFDADVNVLGGINLLVACRGARVCKFIFISTGGALYGDPETMPCDETHPIRPLSPYGTSKYCFEQYLAMFGRSFDLDYTILRYANVYGPRQGCESDEGRVVAIFASRMILNRAVTIDGDGEQARDMLYVSDAVAANLAALRAGSREHFNIGTGAAVTVNQLFEELRLLTDYTLRPNHGPARVGDVRRIVLSSARAGKELGWKPAVSLRDGLAATIEDFRRMSDLAARLDGAANP